MQLKQSLSLFLVCLLSNCSHGPRITVCVSSTTDFDCSDYKGRTSKISLAQSNGFSAYSDNSYHNILDYCAKRTEQGTPVPEFDSCTSNFEKGGFDCVQQLCVLNEQMNGIECIPSNKHFVTYGESDQYIAMSQSDNITVLSFCNIDIKQGVK